MARRKRVEEPENHERWLVSYADFITLLFAFFVVMYSISSVNEGKYRVLSDSMVAAFSDPTRSLDPIQVGNVMRSPLQSETPLDRSKPVIELFRIPLPERDIREKLEKKIREEQKKSELEAEKKAAEEEERIDAASEALADSIEKDMSELVDAGLIDVRRDKRWIEVEIKSSILFGSGAAELSPGSQPVLQKLAETLAPLNNTIHVEGFTDNVPIDNFEFRSNWELSAARAASVVHLFTRLGVRPDRMAAIGYGEYRPITGNDTAQGRSRNRRVVLVIMNGADPRVSEGAEHLQAERDAARTPVSEGVTP
ncbi:Flagellar motor rotation protein MotB [hydrothermal vent metagenome]|uniref:Flagellar motor rotation protein MotB n=1 Tax=hydrothermal vent metagenome TaxID=652676 RepID=A0A3B0YC68_9ZZZZ